MDSTTAMGSPDPCTLTLFAADSPASHSRRPAAGKAPTTPDICGRTSPHAFAYFDPNGCSSKTSLDFSPPTAASPADAYAAGLTDGEGTLTIWQRQGYHHATVEIGMTLPALDVLRSMQQEYGGKVTKMRSATGRWAEAWRWRIFGTEATDFVRRIRPALRLKGPQADILLRLATIPTSSTEAAGLKTKIQELNRKGPTRAPNVVPGVWRPAQQSLLPDLMPSLVIWPTSGMTSSGSAYQRRPLVPRTSDTGSSLWPTPSVIGANETNLDLENWLGRREREKAKGRNGNGMGMPLGVAVQMWPTPTSSDANEWLANPYRNRGSSRPDRKPGDDNLASRVNRMWPTPEASDATGGRVSMELGGTRPSGAKRAITLASAVAHQMWPTPTAQDAANNGGPAQSSRNTPPLNAQVGGSLNPTWVEWLMGFPTGWTDLEPSATP